MLGGTAARQLAKGAFDLTEDGSLTCRKSHVAGQRKLASGTTRATLDLGDAHKVTCAEVTKERRDGRFASQFCRLRAVLADARDIDVGDEVVGIAASENEHANCLVELRAPDQRYEIADELGTEKIHRRRQDVDEENASLAPDLERLK